jgi:serine/threonine-protein kinase
MIGKTLAHFRIVAKLGEGGMGEVWRAEDTKLGRHVAIKVLPAAFTEDDERLARFEREAKVLASLNHRNIAAIHEVGVDAGVHFLAMELAEGEDLAERLARGAMPLYEALPVALQIAEALEAAHEKGIVHRDLKPQNVKLGPDGAVKVLDFGLAKALDPVDPTSGAASTPVTHSPTLTARATLAGVVLGTAAYMAPEQAKGQPADKRADIWAFGVVLWEMLVGRRLFVADTAPETLAQVLTHAPDLDALPSTTPPGIRRLLRRCLQRDPRQRLRDIGDARLELVEAQSEPAPAASIDDVRSRKTWLPWSIAALSVVVAVLGWMVGRARGDTARPGGLLKVRYAKLLSGEEDQSRGFFLSPEGDRAAIAGGGQLQLRYQDGLEPVVLVENLPDSQAAPFWSPDGRFVAYASGGKLWKVPAAGGAPKMICSVPNNYHAGAWGIDDRIVFVLTRGDMYSVPALGGNPEILQARKEGEDVDFHQPTFLPDGRSFVYSLHRPSGVDTIEVSSGGERHVIYRLEGETRLDPQVLNAPIYSATGHLLYRRDSGDEGVWALPFSLDEMAATGEPFLVAGGGRWPSVSRDGSRLAYAEAAKVSLDRLVRVAMDGSTTETIASDLAGVRRASISPSGDRIAFGATVGSGRDLFVTDLEGHTSRLTSTPESEDAPVWSADGTMLYFQRGTGEGTAVYRMPVNGGASPEKIIDRASGPSISTTGRQIVFSTNSRSILGFGYYDLESKKETILADSGSEFGIPVLSPDGRVLAYLSWETGQATLSLRAFPDGTTNQTVIDSRGSRGAWSADSRTLYYWDASQPKVMAVDVASEPALVVGRPRVVLDLAAAGLPPTRQNLLAVFPDDKSFLMAQPIHPGEGRSDVILVENWLEEFERRP